jgi:MED6 mediator sub complex component
VRLLGHFVVVDKKAKTSNFETFSFFSKKSNNASSFMISLFHVWYHLVPKQRQASTESAASTSTRSAVHVHHHPFRPSSRLQPIRHLKNIRRKKKAEIKKAATDATEASGTNSMSETASFVDPVFLARFGLSRINVIDYFLHPLNPFRSTTSHNTSNDILAMQGMSIGILMQRGIPVVTGAGAGAATASGMPGGGGIGMFEPLSPLAAEEEYHKNLARLTGEQYELVPPSPLDLASTQANAQQIISSPLYTIRHVLRTSARQVKVLGIYYVVEGVIYKSPSVRSVMKSNVAKVTAGCLSAAIDSLAACARYQPSVGYLWVFEQQQQQQQNGKRQGQLENPVDLLALAKRRKRRKILDHRRPGERTAAEEEGIRASEAIDAILVRLSKSKWVTTTTTTKPTTPAPSSTTAATAMSSITKSTTKAATAAAATEVTTTGRSKAP